jgi:hypothetical protein
MEKENKVMNTETMVMVTRIILDVMVKKLKKGWTEKQAIDYVFNGMNKEYNIVLKAYVSELMGLLKKRGVK